jgi:DNA mismatch repair protein MSH3
MAAVADFPKRVVVVLAHAIKHLSAFSIADAFLETKFFSKFSTRAHMLLNGNTLTNLSVSCCLDCSKPVANLACSEIYRNETDYTTKGSLMWILDRTVTKFGARLLKSWVGKPLVDKKYSL